MKTLTVCQPWAWAIIHGPKRIENRSVRTNYRGELLIHAGMNRRRLKDYRARHTLFDDDADGLPGLPADEELPFGAIIGVVRLVDCVPLSDAAELPFAEGPWCWILRDPRPIEAFPCSGQLGLWESPPGLILPTAK